MRNKRFFIVLVGALIFGVLAAVSVSKYLSSAQAYSKNLNNVAVAKVAIPIGSKIVRGQLLRSTLPDSDVPVYLVEQDDYYDPFTQASTAFTYIAPGGGIVGMAGSYLAPGQSGGSWAKAGLGKRNNE